jgi:hypothetical protein
VKHFAATIGRPIGCGSAPTSTSAHSRNPPADVRARHDHRPAVDGDVRLQPHQRRARLAAPVGASASSGSSPARPATRAPAVHRSTTPARRHRPRRAAPHPPGRARRASTSPTQAATRHSPTRRWPPPATRRSEHVTTFLCGPGPVRRSRRCRTPRRVQTSALTTASGQEPARPFRWSPYSVSAWSGCCRTDSATGPQVDAADRRRDHRAQEMSPLTRAISGLGQALSPLDDLLLALAPPRQPTPRSLQQKPKITRHHRPVNR